jgi:hypothetical protein
MENNFLEKYIKSIRLYLNDLKERNHLLDNEFESDDDHIEDAINTIYNHALVGPPKRLTYKLEEMVKFLWFRWGVCAYLIDATAIDAIRNTLPYADGGVQIDDNYKAGPFATFAQNLWAKFDAELLKEKIRFNYEDFPTGGTSDADLFTSIWKYR